jgi:hypothetical protein
LSLDGSQLRGQISIKTRSKHAGRAPLSSRRSRQIVFARKGFIPMPCQPHKLLDTPNDPVAPIWRYMDLSKLLAILNDRALFFPSGRQLSRADRLEGQPTYVEVDRLNYDPTAISPENKAAELGVHDPEKLTAFLELELAYE